MSSFASLKLHPTLLQAVHELGWPKPTPIQADAIPPALEGKDLLACASTGSGKTAAFLLPILHQLMSTPRGQTKVLVLTPTRELAAQILEDLNDLAVHTPITGAAIIGGVSMGPQEHAFRSGATVLVATPGRLLDHFQHPYAKLPHLEYLVLDEADRMLDMGFLPDIRKVLRHLPTKRQTLFFSATMPDPIVTLSREMLKQPVTLNLERKAAPAKGITQAVYPVSQELKASLLLHLLNKGEMAEALVFTRTKHRTNRLAEFLEKSGVPVARIHGNRSQGQRTDALDGFKEGRYRVLAATDIVARGIDVTELGHVVNFDVPAMPEDYIHRVGRTARAEATGDAFTFVCPEEEADLRAIEKAIGRRLPRITVPDFDYKAKPVQRFEVPIAERIAAIRARKAEERARAKAKLERKAQLASQEADRRARKDAERPARSHHPARPAQSGSGQQGGSRPAGQGGGRPGRGRRRGPRRGPGGGPRPQ